MASVFMRFLGMNVSCTSWSRNYGEFLRLKMIFQGQIRDRQGKEIFTMNFLVSSLILLSNTVISMLSGLLYNVNKGNLNTLQEDLL